MKRIGLSLLALGIAVPLTSLALPTSAAHAFYVCGAGSYMNSRGHCVPRPVRAASAPVGATAQCRDGTYSFSRSRRGTCSHHGGVRRWL